MLKSLAAAAVDLVYPPRCVVCASRGAWLCPECHARVRQVPAPRCPVCGGPVGRVLPGDGVCRRCAQEPPAFRSAVAAGTYDGVLRTAIRALKYRGLGQVSVPLGRLAAQRFSPDRAAIVVPVPAHPRRTRRRGLDHADLLAEVVAQATGLALAPDGLVRVRATAPQFALDPAERRRNVAGAFAAGRPVRDRTVLLVDDVHTTGATANECAIALLRGGAIAVDVCTVARAILPSTGLDAAGAVAVRR